MNKKLLVKLTGITLGVALLFSGCSSAASSSQGSADKKYTIALDPTYAPFEYVSNGKKMGIDVDLLSAIAKKENIPYQIKIMKFAGIMPGIQAGQVDGSIGAISITDERKKTIDFSDPYYDSGLTTIVKKDSNIKSLNDLKGKTVVVKKGTTGAKFAEDNKDKYGFNIKYLDDSPSMFLEVKNGTSDATFDDYPVIGYKISIDKNSGLKIVGGRVTKDQYGFAVKKGSNSELLKKFNKGLKELKADGEYDKIIKKYVNVK